MKQTKKESLFEVLITVGIGFGLSLVLWSYVVVPMIKRGWITIDDNVIITGMFTVLAVIRGFVLRRHWNKVQLSDWFVGVGLKLKKLLSKINVSK